MSDGPIKVEGDAEVLANLKRLAGEYPNATGAALYDEAQAIMDESQKIVPRDTGRLASSQYVAPPVEATSGPEVELGYATNYAMAVHEIPPPPDKSPGGRSATHENGQQWKYLETPLKAAFRGFAERLARRIRGNVESGKSMPVLPAAKG